MRAVSQLLALLCLSVATAELTVCYFNSAAVYRPEGGYFDIDNIDPSLCTHVIYAFAGVSNETWGIESFDPSYSNCVDDVPPGEGCAYERLVALKDQNPDLIVLLSVGGWSEGSDDFSTMCADPAKRALFVESSVAQLEEDGFDGLDVDWEFPTTRGGVPEDKDNFILLLDDLRAAFDSRGLLLMAALSSAPEMIETAYDIEGLNRTLDLFLLMTYDYHGAWEDFTYLHAPLCGLGSTDPFPGFNLAAGVDHYIAAGVPPEKLVLGIPLYGRCYTLDDFTENGVLAPASQPGPAGPYTGSPGTQGFNEICERLLTSSDCFVTVNIPQYQTYMTCESDNIWCSYDTVGTATRKAKYAKFFGLAGAMVFSLDTDDFNGNCGNPSGLITAINDALALPPDPAMETVCYL